MTTYEFDDLSGPMGPPCADGEPWYNCDHCRKESAYGFKWGAGGPPPTPQGTTLRPRKGDDSDQR